MTWKTVKVLAVSVDARIINRDGEHYLKYDAHGECFVATPEEAFLALQAYKGTHPNWKEQQE